MVVVSAPPSFTRAWDRHRATVSGVENIENNDSVSKSWIVFRHGIVAKLTSAMEFFAAEDLVI